MMLSDTRQLRRDFGSGPLALWHIPMRPGMVRLRQVLRI
jgi:hypothetical protein